MKTITLKISAVFAAMMSMFAVSALAEPLIITFEDGETSGWSDTDASVTVTTESNPSDNFAVTGISHAKSLAIAGETSRVITGDEANANIIDLLVRVKAPSAAPTAADVGDGAQFAIASGVDGKLYVYCKTSANAEEATFDTALGSTVYEDGTWVRLTVNVNYSDHSFTVAVNGTGTGSTYYTVNSTTTAINSVVVKGDGTGIDDFVAKNGSSTEPMKASTSIVDASGNPVIIPPEYYATTGVTDVDTKVSGAPLTVAQAYQAGVDPTADFRVANATVSETTLTLTLPETTWPAGSYTVKYGTTAACETTVNATADGRTLTVTLPEDFGDGNVLYYKVIR